MRSLLKGVSTRTLGIRNVIWKDGLRASNWNKWKETCWSRAQGSLRVGLRCLKTLLLLAAFWRAKMQAAC